MKGGDRNHHGGMFQGRKKIQAVQLPLGSPDDESGHQAQGGAKPRALLDLNGVFLLGQWHVMFSRVLQRDDMFILGVGRCARSLPQGGLEIDWTEVQKLVSVCPRALIFWDAIGELEMPKYQETLQRARQAVNRDETTRLQLLGRHHGAVQHAAAAGVSA